MVINGIAADDQCDDDDAANQLSARYFFAARDIHLKFS